MPESLRFAHGLFRERKFDLAAEEYEQFLSSSKAGQDADDARFGLAISRLFQGRYKESRKAFQEFIEAAPGHPRARTARYRLGELSYMLGDLREARKWLELFVDGPPHQNLETAWTYLGDVCFGLEDLPAARVAYERSLADFPKGPLADRSRYGLGKSLAGLGELEAATTILTKLARDGGPDWIDRTRVQLGKAQLAGGHADDALKTFEAVSDASGNILKGEATLGRAESLARLGRSDEAVKLLTPQIAGGIEPSSSRAALSLATIELERSRPDEARRVLEQAIERSPNSPAAPALLFRLAESLQKQGRNDEARARFLKLAEDHAKDPWADDALARAVALSLEAKDYPEAVRLARLFDGNFGSSPLASEVQLVEARALRAAGKVTEALPLLEELTGEDRPAEPPGPQRPRPLNGASLATARYELALAYRDTGQPAKADALLALLAEEAKSPVGADARFLMGQELVEKGRFADAIGPLMQYLASGPKPEVADYALAHLAVAQIGTGRFEDAWRTGEELASRFPGSVALPGTRMRLAEAALARGQDDRAAQQFRQILGTSPAAGESKPVAVDPATIARAQVGLGRALWKLGKPAEAAELFGKFLEAGKSSASAPAVALERAGALEAAGQAPAAIEAYKAVSDEFPKAPQAAIADRGRARLLARGGKFEEAAKLLEELISQPDRLGVLEKAGEHSDTLRAERAWALADAGKTADADTGFAELLKLFPESRHAVDARFHLAETANQAGNHKEVIRLLATIAGPSALDAQAAQGPPNAAVSPVTPLAIYRLARSQIEVGDWNSASTTLDHLIRDFPDHPRQREARYLRAEAALQRNQPALAEEDFARLDSGPPVPSDPPGFAALVGARHIQSLLGLKRWKDALDRAEALKTRLPAGDPAIAELDFARGRALLGLARPDEARQALQAVIDARKGGELAAQSHLLIGETYFHQDRFREALRDFLKVDILYDAPRWQAAALLEAGKVYERLGQWSDAAETYDRLRTRFPEDPHAAEAEARLSAARKQAHSAGGKAKVF